MTTQPELSVTIATYTPQGILRVQNMNLPEVPGVEYVVSWQNHSDAPIPPELASRADIHIHRFGQSGVSANRNNALAHASGRICLIADDDLRYIPRNLTDVIDAFNLHPDTEFAVFQYTGRHHSKSYPAGSLDITHKVPRHFYPVCFEMAFLREATMRTRPLLFSTYFGPGASVLTAGEDDFIFLQARRMGLKCRFFPITITVHDAMPTGLRPITHPGVLRTNGAIIALTHPFTFPARIPVNAWRIMKSGRAPLATAIGQMFRGAFHALGKKNLRRAAFLP